MIRIEREKRINLFPREKINIHLIFSIRPRRKTEINSHSNRMKTKKHWKITSNILMNDISHIYKQRPCTKFCGVFKNMWLKIYLCHVVHFLYSCDDLNDDLILGLLKEWKKNFGCRCCCCSWILNIILTVCFYSINIFLTYLYYVPSQIICHWFKDIIDLSLMYCVTCEKGNVIVLGYGLTSIYRIRMFYVRYMKCYLKTAASIHIKFSVYCTQKRLTFLRSPIFLDSNS